MIAGEPQLYPTLPKHEVRPPSSAASSDLEPPNAVTCQYLPSTYYLNQAKRPQTTAGVSSQQRIQNRNGRNGVTRISLSGRNDGKRPATHEGTSPSKQNAHLRNAQPPPPRKQRKFKRELSAHTKTLFKKFELERQRYMDKQRMTYSITPLDPDAYEEKKRQKEKKKRDNDYWNTRFRPHDIKIEKKKEDEKFRPWTAAMAGSNIIETERNRITSMSETQRELASYFGVQNYDKYVNRIPPLRTNLRKKKPNPYLNLPPRAPAPKIPKRPYKMSPRRLRKNLNPYSDKQILWPKDKQFDLSQYKLMYEASKHIIRDEASCWHAFWAKNSRKRTVRYRMEGNPFSYSYDKEADPSKGHDAGAPDTKPKYGFLVRQRQQIPVTSTNKDGVVHVPFRPPTKAPSMFIDEMGGGDVAEKTFYDNNVHAKSNRPNTTSGNGRRSQKRKNVRWKENCVLEAN